MSTKKDLVIVESPAKAKTLAKMLGAAYRLEASKGHVRDLPKSSLGVDIEQDFQPKYVISADKRKVVTELKKLAGQARNIILATDPDREGEAIAWHIKQITDLADNRYQRVIFHEITREAIDSAFKQPKIINLNLVDAQQSRRVLDRLVGYKLSPLLWKKVQKGLSAGRVQSVAVRIIVDRENEINSFNPREYWVLEAKLAKQPAKSNPSFMATLVALPGKKKAEIGTQDQANNVKDELEKAAYRVLQVKIKTVNRQPAAPFITSTLQQEASRRFRFSAKQTMAIAQQLYEGIPIGQEGNLGLITYMRTDSTHVARQVLDEARLYIKNTYGPDFLPPHARVFTTAVKGAQEAHEAIRPTSINRRPESIKPFLNINQFKLYQLIWQRMVASQMAAARYENTTVDIEAKTNDRNKYLLKSNSSVNVFTGFLALYVEARDEAEEETGTVLPPLDTNEALDLVSTNAQQRFTKPPSRYTEATLIKELEANGIGRPSTYAPTISTIIEREYVSREKNQLKPTDLGIVVNNFLVEYFPEIVNVEFTANMEGKLDGVAEGNQKWTEVVAEFYQPLSQKLEQVEQYARKINPPAQETGQNCPKCSKPLVVKVGRFGKFLCHPEYPDVNELGCKHTSSYQIKTGIICPECQQGEIVEKWNSKKKHAFYGCSRYPECKLATNFKPLATPCPQCGGMMTEYRIKWSVCQKCGHKAKLETNERSI